jgi:uncharacterized membrane protein
MMYLIVGLFLFLGIHSINILTPVKRQILSDKFGEKKWKLVYSVISIVGFILIIKGYADSRMAPIWLWTPPPGLRHLALLLTVPAFILLVAAYVPGNRIKAKLGHPMFAAVKLWALAHLLANGSLADVLLFGSFLVWAIVGFAVCRRRDRIAGVQRIAGNVKSDITTVFIGVVTWAAFAMFLHTALIGVSPLP